MPKKLLYPTKSHPGRAGRKPHLDEQGNPIPKPRTIYGDWTEVERAYIIKWLTPAQRAKVLLLEAQKKEIALNCPGRKEHEFFTTSNGEYTKTICRYCGKAEQT